MLTNIPTAGGVNPELAQKITDWWQDAARESGINLEGFDPSASLSNRIAWALQAGLLIATGYLRHSTKLQHSTEDQGREIVVWGARNRMYVPPELVSMDEAVTGKSLRRVGLERMKAILRKRHATVLLVYKVSRLFRQAYKGFELIQGEVVEAGLRAVSISQGIDTDDKKGWKLKINLHGLVDDMLLDAIADHVRIGQVGLFQNGYTTGATGVGYRRKEIPNAPLTNRGLPRTASEVDPEVAKLIQKHASLLLSGMSLKDGLRRWIAESGPCDPRSPSRHMTYGSYRRLWSNIRLTGRWEFGRKRNEFSTTLDYVRKIEQPESEVVKHHVEDLRILDDETFQALQSMLSGHKTGPRGPRKEKQKQLWDLTKDLFYCAHCSQPGDLVRYYQTGANGLGMQCKNGDQCPCRSVVRREEAVRAVCCELACLIRRDTELTEQVICRSCELDGVGDDSLRTEIASLESSIAAINRKLNDLFELAGMGSDDDRKDVRARIRSAQSQRGEQQTQLASLKRVLDRTTSTITPDAVRAILAEMSTLLSNAATGQLGDESVYKALAIMKSLTGGQIMVHVERREGRKRKNVRGVFRTHLIRAVKEQADMPNATPSEGEEVTVWLREPPRVDALADRVHHLIDIEGLSQRDTAKRLCQEGYKVNSGNVWYSYQRYYEMLGQTAPKAPYNKGLQRKSG